MSIECAPHWPSEEECAHAKKLGLPSDETHVSTMFELAGRAFERKRYEGARKILLGLLLVRPQEAKIFEALGLAYQAEGRVKDARLCFEAAIEKDGDSL